MVQATNMQTNLQEKEQFFLEKFAKKIWVVLTTTSNLGWIKYFLSIGASALTVLVMIFDFAFFRQVAKDYLPFKDDTVLWFIAAFCCVFIVVLLKLVFSAIIELWIEQRNDYQGIKSYSLQFWGLGVLLIGLLFFALYASNNGVLVTAKNNIVFAKLPENTDLQAAKDSLAASQKYYNNMIAKEQGDLEQAKKILEKDTWNVASTSLAKGAIKQKEILISAKLEQAKYWQNRINKIENRFYEEVQQVKAANKLLETETVSNTKAVSMYAYAALFFLSLVSVFIFYDGNKGNPSPTVQQGTGDKSYVVDNQGVGIVGNSVGNVGNGGSVGILQQLRMKKIHIYTSKYKKFGYKELIGNYGELIANGEAMILHGDAYKNWNYSALEKNIFHDGNSMASNRGTWLREFWIHYEGLKAVMEGNYEQALHEQGGQGV